MSTINGPQNAYAHQVTDQNVQKQRQVHLFPHFSYYHPPKISSVRPPHLAFYQIFKKMLKNLKVITKNVVADILAEFFKSVTTP
jgi:hypothetical protein